jgi:hypothetical protein
VRRAEFSAAIAPRRIAQKVLLLAATGTEPAYLAARDALSRIGVPYQAVIATQQALPVLTDGGSTCYYSAVVLSTSQLAYGGGSALTTEQWAQLASFEVACSAREAVWYAYPSPDLGFNYPDFGWSGATFTTNTGFVANASFLRRVPATAQVSYHDAYGYRATIINSTATTPIIRDSYGYTLLATTLRADGTEVLVSTVDNSPYLEHSLALEFDMIRWLTRGMFVGQKHAFLAPQVDDIFIDADMWVVGEGNSDDGTTTFRISGTDLNAFVGWQTAFAASLPPGSTYVTTMAFNGWGTTADAYSDTTLLAAARQVNTNLRWLDHTWDHENMDGMSRKHARNEVRKNCQLAQSLNLSQFTCSELVTPDMSGLDSRAAIRGMYDAGVRYLETDTSVTGGNNPSFNVGIVNSINTHIYMVPRHPTNIFYDVAMPANEADEYNTYYRSYWGRDLTYAEIIDVSSVFNRTYLLQGDIDTLMFHQANLANYDGNAHSLLGDLISSGARKYLALQNAPILTLSQSAIATAMKERGAFDKCGATATIVESTTGRSLELRSVGSCKVPVTGVRWSDASVEDYAGDPITTFTLDGVSVLTIPLP